MTVAYTTAWGTTAQGRSMASSTAARRSEKRTAAMNRTRALLDAGRPNWTLLTPPNPR
jgi:hypothetical protein